MSAPPQGSGGGGLSPSAFLGTFSGSNPSNPANGQWWYRVDTGQLFMNVSGTIMPVQSTGNVTVIASNTTIANADVWNAVLILPGVTLTIYGSIVFHGNVTVLKGATLLSSNPNASSTSPQANGYLFLGYLYLNGTYSIAQYNTDNIWTSITITTANSSNGANPVITGAGTLSAQGGFTINCVITISVSSITGPGTFSLASGATVVLSNNYTFSSSTPSFTGSGTIQIGSGYTLTLNKNVTWSFSITGSGTLSIGSGYTLTVGVNITYSVATITGSGTLAIASGYTLTAGSALTLSVANVSVAGTFNTNSQTLTIPSGATVTWKTTGSVSGGGTLTVNGTFYYYGISLSNSSTCSIPSAPWSLNGTGVALFTSTNSSSGGNTLTLSSTSIATGTQTSSATGTGIAPRIALTSIMGSAAGIYGINAYDSTSSSTPCFQVILAYIGTANTTYSVNFTGVAGQTDTSGDSITVFNCTGSAGTVTLSGTLYA
jgi:hypothetical protein